MVLFTVFTIVVLSSAVFYAVAIRALYAYINQYRFDESVYTLLFGFMRLRYFVYLYGLLVAASAVLGFSFAFLSIQT